jgi:hypothetical protein
MVSGAAAVGGKTVACYWLDGARSVLPVPKGTTRSEATGIAFGGGHTYISGTAWLNEKATPCLWIDGVQSELPIGPTKKPSRGGNATSVTVESENWVIGGFWTNDSTTLPCYWMNGVRHDLESPGSKNSLGTILIGVLLKNGRVYSYGFFYEKGFAKACYWIDDEFHNGPANGARESAILGLSVQNDGVVLVGKVRLDKKTEGFLWNVGKLEILPMSTSANGVFFQDGQTWILGFSSDNRACFWLNGKYIPLPGNVTTDQGFEARSFARLGDHLLVAGARSWDQGYSREAIVWDNQEYKSLDSKGRYATALSVEGEK